MITSTGVVANAPVINQEEHTIVFPVVASRSWVSESGELKKGFTAFLVAYSGPELDNLATSIVKGSRVAFSGNLLGTPQDDSGKGGGEAFVTKQNGGYVTSYRVLANEVTVIGPNAELQEFDDITTLSLHGNLGRDPEMRYIPSGKAVLSVSVAVNWRTPEKGEWVKKTTWVRLSCWGKTAERANELWRKGTEVLITRGILSADPVTGGPKIWDDKSGEKRASYEVTVWNYDFCGRREANGSGSVPDYQGSRNDDDEIPF